MLFRGEEGLKPTDALSGGEAARLIFCKLMMQKPNILVLDEPTNHLDLESINALNIALQRYEGTVLLVTHDHDLIDEVATRIWHFDGTAQSRTSKARTRNTLVPPLESVSYRFHKVAESAKIAETGPQCTSGVQREPIRCTKICLLTCTIRSRNAVVAQRRGARRS